MVRVFVWKRKDENETPKFKKEKTGVDDQKKQINKQESRKTPSTQKGVKPPESPESPVGVSKSTGGTGETGGNPPVSVDDKTPLGTTVIVSEDKRRVTVEVYDAGEDEKIEDDKVVKRRKLKFVIKYKNVVKECVDECDDAVSEIAKATHYNVSKADIRARIEELKERFGNEEVVPLIEYVKEKYADELAELEKDPFKWVLERTKEIVGYERVKLLTFLSVVSTRLERVPGISRIHVLLVGPSGAGKSSTIKSVLKLAGDIVIKSTRITQNALGYLNVKSFDGYVLFIEQIDNQTMNYLRELMSEERVCTLVAEKSSDEQIATRRICIEGQPAVVSTSVVDKIDVDREQLFNRFIKVYVKPDVNAEHIWGAILERSKTEEGDVDALVFRAWLLSRPDRVEISEEVKAKVINFMKMLSEYTREPLNRTVEIVRNLVATVAIARGKTVADLDDFEFVAKNFMLDILYNGLGLSERDVEFIEALPDDDALKSSEVADALKVSKQYAINVLKNLERKGIVESTKEDGKTFKWWLTPLGKQIKALVNNVNVDVIETEEGVADAFSRNDDAGRGSLRRNDGNEMSGDEDETEETNEFTEYIKRNAGVTKEFVEIVEDFGNKAKANRFVNYCLKKGLCRQRGVDAFEIVG